MAFELVWSERAKKDLNQLPRETIIRILQKAETAKQYPYRFLQKLVGEKSWKLRVGDYRVIIEINNEQEKLDIVHVRHRKNAYKWP